MWAELRSVTLNSNFEELNDVHSASLCVLIHQRERPVTLHQVFPAIRTVAPFARQASLKNKSTRRQDRVRR